MPRLRIFLAEDHSVVREGLKLLINSQPDMEVVGEAGNGLETLTRASELRPDVVVMDVSLPELSGSKVTQRLKQQKLPCQILALSVHEDKSYLRKMMEAGASGYVLKRAAAEELINAIRTVANGGSYLDTSLEGKALSSLSKSSSSEEAVRESTLSLRETEVIRLIAQGYSNKEIANQLNISVKTVETYKARALEKTGMQSRADIVRYAIQRGWLQE